MGVYNISIELLQIIRMKIYILGYRISQGKQHPFIPLATSCHQIFNDTNNNIIDKFSLLYIIIWLVFVADIMRALIC